ncbi:hypothetical protein JL101_029070 (plasmid) [Skermanella rosea]|uniref:hypothetical protein n=1 Tax=Skermanella rosea TaxID=1817965 RepID=UPI001934A646|nr:hypothetical protein [Skermanella rosea]UEM07056.1 hypothetical protein JL101_029070 [Skermanella rosea]
MRRRSFLLYLLPLPFCAAGLPLATVKPVTALLPDPFSSAFGDVEAMRILGRRFLELHPEETIAVRSWLAVLEEAGQDAMLGHTARRIRQDLHDGNVVVVDGWVLPHSIALTCSAVSLA